MSSSSSAPGTRWRRLDHDQSHHISCISYNVLAETYAKPEYFPATKPEHLSWSHRFPLIIKDIITINADIICLQECDHPFEFEIALARFGYAMSFKKRTNITRYKPDGLAIFCKLEKFQLLNNLEVEYNNLLPMHGHNKDFATDNVGLALLLQTTVLSEDGIPQPQLLCVSTTHLFWKLDGVKGGQATYFLQQIEAWLDALHVPATIPLILCGDFNSKPDSDVFRSIVDAKQRAPIAQEFCFESANANHQRSGEPDFTHFVLGFRATIDYVFYQSLKLHSILELPKSEEPLPTADIPSDHLAVGAKFTFETNKAKAVAQPVNRWSEAAAFLAAASANGSHHGQVLERRTIVVREENGVEIALKQKEQEVIGRL